MLKAQPVLVHSRTVELPPPGAEITDQELEVVMEARRGMNDLDHRETATEGKDGLGAFRGLKTGIAAFVGFGIFVWLVARIFR